MDKFIEELLLINPNYDVELIKKAYLTAEKWHEGQLRKSGEPYLIHPVCVAKILAEIGMDEDTIIAGLLHDVVEDTPYTIEELTKDFGEDVALLVDGVTKLGSIVFESKEERQAENLRKMFLAMSKDIRVIIIKLADRLHNLRTINYMSEKKIIDKCNETLEIYAPLASRLGIYAIKFELEDIALKFLDKDAYYELVEAVKSKKDERQSLIDSVITSVKESLDDLDIHYDITGRSKHFYSIYKKMKYQHKQIDEIFDLTAVRIIVDTIKDCYAVLGVVHTRFKPLPGRFKDYIAMPKTNMYQSLHTTVLGDNGKPFEIQIRTYDMHKVAELGIAAHWKYKEGISSSTVNVEEMKLAWLRQTLEWQKEMNDPKEFMETLRVDLFASQVYVFTPMGDIMELPAGSTPLDFAFKIHSDVGYKCIGAKVNGKMVPIDHVLQNGNLVEIVTSSNSKGPSTDWLKIVKSSHARNKIRSFLKKENKTGNAEKGKELLEKYIKRKGYETASVIKPPYLSKIAKQQGFATLEELYAQLSFGGTFLGKIAIALIEHYHEEKQEELKNSESNLKNLDILDSKVKKKKKSSEKSAAGVKVKGSDNLLIRFSRCCNPVPGDEIVGFITKGRGISVHRKDCVNMLSIPENEKDRLIEVEWDTAEAGSYNVDICILAEDRKGLFSDISRACEDLDIHIAGVNAKSGKDQIINITMSLSISDTKHMEKLLRALRNIPSVADVYRAIV
ncbi:MAG: RelA/SpoT family protein [Eubacteriales bacterium]